MVVIEKNLHISGPTQFKPVLFKGHLYSPGIESLEEKEKGSFLKRW